jgi:SAM-dependent methyltransferase
MHPVLVQKLISLNKQFYSEAGADFNNTRSYSWAGWEKLAETFSAEAFTPQTILDLGCGNGRFFKFAQEHFSVNKYLGIDSSKELLQYARENFKGSAKYAFKELDFLSQPQGLKALGKYDLIVVMGVMHHIPGKDLRELLLKQLKVLLNQKGLLVITFWEFIANKQLAKKIVPWEAAGVDPGLLLDLDPHDYLMDWKQGGVHYRYCHYYTEAETTNLFKAAGLHVKQQFQADGPGGKANLYYVLSI